MAPTSTAKASTDKPARKPVRSGSSKKKMTAFNKFMKTEMARLKDDKPDITHKERFVLATSNWKDAKENPKHKA